MSQAQFSNSSYFSSRPREASLLPLAPVRQITPPAQALLQLPQPSYPRSLSGSSVHDAVLPKYPKSISPVDIAQDIRARNLGAQRRMDVNGQVDEPQLFIAVARYFINSEFEDHRSASSAEDEDPVTLILVHANSFHKETWEPMLAHLLVSPVGRKIREVWAVDGPQYGDSAVINLPNLGLSVDGGDFARDLLNLILFYLPDESFCRSENIPVVLPQLECPISSFALLDQSPLPAQLSKPIHWRNRKLGLIGHSMGGTIAALAATSIPELFHYVILLDPVMSSLENFSFRHLAHLLLSAIRRREQWENSEMAWKSFQGGQNFFGLCDPPVLRRYVQYALKSDRPTELKCNKLHEASASTDAQNRVSQAYLRLLDCYKDGHEPPFNLSLILANTNESTFPEKNLRQNPFLTQEKLAVRHASLRHLMIQENPRHVASLISQSLMKRSHHAQSFQDEFHNLISKL
ncbi:hypothetical protein PCANC_07008 [Puccinia coronata f. sp. avenae]|uniref:AB hydrolase-1 domain-containing protein n=1 Tax=Puccinia coronata f. sp. avenae TaxID=200324 RepID=A0A2N5UZL7_9BASI|nr:hypothetical protein PCANC_07008 [Puccinia coronata f. sp. avenae]